MMFAALFVVVAYARTFEVGIPVDGTMELVCTIETEAAPLSLVECARAALAASPVAGMSAVELARRAVGAVVAKHGPKAAAAVCREDACVEAAAAALAATLAETRSTTYDAVVAAVARVVGREPVRVCGDVDGEYDFVIVDASCDIDASMRALRRNTGVLATPTRAAAPGYDVAVGRFDDGFATLVVRRPPRGPFETTDPNLLVVRATTRTGLDARVARAASCDEVEARHQARLWTAQRAAVVGDRDSWEVAALLGCPRPLDMILDASVSRVAFVGANKGYGLARLLGILAPDLGVSPSAWGRVLRDLGARYACGWCRDCLDDGGAPGSASVLEAHLIEPLGANVDLLRAALRRFGFQNTQNGSRWTKSNARESSATVVLHQIAAGIERGEAWFPRLAAGEEVGAVCAADCQGGHADESSFERIRVESLDEILLLGRRDFFPRLDALFVDAEGADPLILGAGASATLAATRFLQFEYHFRGAWATHALGDVVARLDTALDMECFLQGPGDVLWRLSSRCWDEAFEIRQWSNVACVARGDAAWHHLISQLAPVV